MSTTILGIESSCDDTSSSVIRDGVMLSNVIASQAVHVLHGVVFGVCCYVLHLNLR